MSTQFNKGKQLIVAIILGILTYWLFAQSFLNIAPHVQRFYHVDMSIVNIAVSLTSLLIGVFIVVAGGLIGENRECQNNECRFNIKHTWFNSTDYIPCASVIINWTRTTGIICCMSITSNNCTHQFILPWRRTSKSIKLLVIWFLWWYWTSFIVCKNYRNVYRMALYLHTILLFLLLLH